MAMTITAIPDNTAYVLVGTDGSYSAIQNIGHNDLWINIAASLPTATDEGFILKPLDTITVTWGAGNVYARTKQGVGRTATSA